MSVKMVKVELLTDTAYQGPRKKGDTFKVPEDFAKRWVKNGIAKYAEDTVENEDVSMEQDAADTVEDQTDTEQVETPETDYASMSAKELYALCKDQGIEVEAKKSKEYYVEKLTAKE